MSKPFYVSLPGRGLIHLEGEDCIPFLDALVSNDVTAIPAGKCVYACLLTPQGKFLHDFFVHTGNGFLLLDCEGGARAHDLYDRLLKYRLRAKVKISIEESHAVYAILSSSHPGLDPGSMDPDFRQDAKKDPRHPDMGNRSFEKPDSVEERAFAEWDVRRISLCIPDGSRDLEVERSTLDEGHIDSLNGINWDKGCYVGQELTARMKYRGLGKKHLYTVTFANGIAPEPFTDLPNGGQMRSSCGDIGLALLKDGENTCL